MSEQDDIIHEFVAESLGLLDQTDQDLVVMEKSGVNADLIRSVFRTFHTIKGSAGFLGFTKLHALTLASETVLGRARNGKLTLNAEMIHTLGSSAVTVRKLVETVGKPEHDHQPTNDLVATLQRYVESAAP